MNKIKQQFLNMRDATPKHVQWLLLGAAFVVVLILFTLLMTGNNKQKTPTVTKDEIPVKITLSSDTVDWSNVTVGTKKTETISVKTTAPAKVSMGQNKTVDGFTAKTTCTEAAVINAKISCNVFLEYAPTIAAKPETLTLYIYWRGENEPESMKTAEKVIVVLGAAAPEKVATTAPTQKTAVVSEPEYDDDEDDFDYDDYVAPKTAAAIEHDIKSIAPSDPFDEPYATPTPKSAPKPVVNETVKTKQNCSEFAFPGYDNYGTQIGWIKPERGGYYFHPFSDKDCKNATGIYNADTGIITDINVAGKRIGTDAEHINSALATGIVPTLSESPRARKSNRSSDKISDAIGTMGKIDLTPAPVVDVTFGTTDSNAIVATQPYDRTFILRQYKPIPATIVSDVRADVALDADNLHFPVRATVDRNVYSDNGRTIIIPTGTLMLGYVTGNIPGPYKAIGRMNIKWYQFILPNGVEFNFNGAQEPSSADAQGRIGVPGRGSTDYLEQFVMPMLTSIVPAAVNMIAPVADKFVNQIDLDNNTVVQSGTMRSSELAKNEIITTWNQVAQKLLVDMMDNTVPPFTIPAGTRITVYSPYDLMVACTDSGKKCWMDGAAARANTKRSEPTWNAHPDYSDGSWTGQARSFNLSKYCVTENGVLKAPANDSNLSQELQKLGYSYSTLVAYCQSSNYQAINNAKQEAVYQNQQSTSNANSIASTGGKGSQAYNEKVLGLKYDDNGAIENPFQQKSESAPAQTESLIKCEDGTPPDGNGCCTGEIYTDMGDQGFNCCPETGGDCFPPIL
ncbi:MAG: TrbI/VirB10 family protein [Alphaproteobacteria bacterium]|nr:TrbI/VirB10 family protein [Alphaproteobacteria bacterium]